MSRRVLGPESRKRRKACWQSCGAWVVRRGGATDLKGCQTSPVSAVGNDWREASLSRQDGGWGGAKGVGGPCLDPRPKAVHAPEGAGVGGMEVGPVG